MPAPCRLDLAAIDRSLCKVQLRKVLLAADNEPIE